MYLSIRISLHKIYILLSKNMKITVDAMTTNGNHQLSTQKKETLCVCEREIDRILMVCRTVRQYRQK